MKKYHVEQIVHCKAEEAPCLCHEALKALGWNINDSGDWGMICGLPRSAASSGIEFEVTWRNEGRKTRLSIYGPLHDAPTDSIDPASLAEQLNHQIEARATSHASC